MFSITFDLEEAIEKAKDAGACEKDLYIIKSLDSIKNILKHKKAAYWLYWYALEVIRGRWTEAEEYIMKDPRWAYWYARDIIKDRQYEVEEYIMKDPEWSHFYSEFIIKRFRKEL